MSAAASAAVTSLQLAANRANALHSTGPLSAHGKLASSRNALSHGLTTSAALLPSEDPGDYKFHHQIQIDHYRPQDDIARALVTELADLEWRLRRVPAFEAQLLSIECHNLKSNPELEPFIKGLHTDAQILAVAFTRLVERKILPNLLNQESRIARRADKIRRRLEQQQQQQPQQQEPTPPPNAAAPEIIMEMENWKNEPNPPQPQPVRTNKVGRNEPCPCRSGLKFKRCCLNKPATATAGSSLGSA
jgi:hypothetical protein